MSIPNLTFGEGLTIGDGITISLGSSGGGGGGGNTYTAVQASINTGSNGIHIDTSYPWAASVPVGATIVAAGYGTLTVLSIYTPTDPSNFSGNWFFVVTPTTYNFAGGTNLTFTW